MASKTGTKLDKNRHLTYLNGVQVVAGSNPATPTTNPD